ncbi:MAG TPA: hypothetical protein PLW39_10530 [Thermoflexales bacterium]|nr:hypothetical protein [Thermoflexales bacterium]HQW36511.1 hypothetical protein [Thermoflexales bacterium]HQZ22691.1 hypothetical protein [Thermoflexales bacterium]
MIAVIHVSLSNGDINRPEDFVKILKDSYPNAIPENILDIFSRPQNRMLEAIYKNSDYICVPAHGSCARFLWLDSRSFEIYIENTHEGHLVRSAKHVIQVLNNNFHKLKIKVDFEVEIKSTSDFKGYFRGISISKSKYKAIIEVIGINAPTLAISAILILISNFWLTQFFQESIAGFIALILSTMWQMWKKWTLLDDDQLNWIISEER